MFPGIEADASVAAIEKEGVEQADGENRPLHCSQKCAHGPTRGFVPPVVCGRRTRSPAAFH